MMKSHWKSWITVILLLSAAAYALAEELTLTTYYPSPRGVYQELRVMGALGVGTTNPGNARLQVVGDINSTVNQLSLKFSPDETEEAVMNHVPGGGLNIHASRAGGANKPLGFYTGGGGTDRRVTISGDGNVGIGTPTPSAKLQVEGEPGSEIIKGYRTTSTQSDRLFALHSDVFSVAEQKFFVRADGMVGLGRNNTNPQGYLDVIVPEQLNALSVQTPTGNAFVTVQHPLGGVRNNAINPAASILYIGNSDATGRSINASGSINAAGQDYAEWVPWPGEQPEPGTIVLYKGRHMVVSSPKTAAFTGGDREDPDAVLLAFVGQVPVKVIGRVQEGDYILANADGTGFAVGPAQLTFEQFKQAVGIAWESSEVEAVKTITVAIGVK